MLTLRSNLVKRIERLPKPTNVAMALQPLFEAISNAIHSTQLKFGDSVASSGMVRVEVVTDRKKESVFSSVYDNGNGLNQKNWDSFLTTDTEEKIEIGGKGVGRLLWLDCFPSVSVESDFEGEDGLARRKFKFVLSVDNQIRDYSEVASGSASSSFRVTFEGLRDNGYRKNFPGRGNFVFQHVTSHFLPTFIGGRCPKVIVRVGEEERIYPKAIDEIVHRRKEGILLSSDDFGQIVVTLMECDKVASSDLKGSHFVHFVAHDRTVHSQCVDGRLGLKYFGPEGDRVFHAIVTGKFFDDNVNQERTAFMFEDSVIEKIINEHCIESIEDFLEEPLSVLRGEQREKIESIAATYPSVAFGNIDELQGKVPSGELKEDALYGHLSRERYRRDERQASKVRAVLRGLKEGTADVEAFYQAIEEAGSAIELAEQQSLAEYVVRRKVILDFVEILLEKVRDETSDSSYQKEDILHSFICPLKVETITDEKRKVETASSHDLWIVDERLTFAQYFSSDVEFSKLAKEYGSEDRADLIIFDYVHGLRQTDDPSKVLLVEFKRPGRKSYDDGENPQHQVERYIRRLQSGSLLDVKGRPIKLDQNTIFYCFIVADIIGKIDDWTYSWQRTADGRGRIYRPESGFYGSVELIGWDSLILDARERNKAFFDRAGISGESFFTRE